LVTDTAMVPASARKPKKRSSGERRRLNFDLYNNNMNTGEAERLGSTFRYVIQAANERSG
jgi:hypothetical protein